MLKSRAWLYFLVQRYKHCHMFRLITSTLFFIVSDEKNACYEMTIIEHAQWCKIHTVLTLQNISVIVLDIWQNFIKQEILGYTKIVLNSNIRRRTMSPLFNVKHSSKSFIFPIPVKLTPSMQCSFWNCVWYSFSLFLSSLTLFYSMST